MFTSDHRFVYCGNTRNMIMKNLTQPADVNETFWCEGPNLAHRAPGDREERNIFGFVDDIESERFPKVKKRVW